jgi:hypothetical protein
MARVNKARDAPSGNRAFSGARRLSGRDAAGFAATSYRSSATVAAARRNGLRRGPPSQAARRVSRCPAGPHGCAVRRCRAELPIAVPGPACAVQTTCALASERSGSTMPRESEPATSSLRYATAGPGARRRSTNRPRRTPADAGAERRTNRGRIPRNRASATRGVIRRALTPIGPSRHNVPEKRGRSPFASDCSGETFHAPRKRDPTPFLLRHFSCAISPATNVLTAQPFACTCDVTRVTCLRVVCAPAPLHSITAAPRLTTTCFTRSWLTHDAPQRERT